MDILSTRDSENTRVFFCPFVASYATSGLQWSLDFRRVIFSGASKLLMTELNPFCSALCAKEHRAKRIRGKYTLFVLMACTKMKSEPMISI
jgi:hypothetical protein